MIDPHAYSITVRRSNFEDDFCFEARVKGLPDLAEYGDTFEEAYNLAIDAIEATADIFEEKGKKLPEPPEVIDDYSGRVTLRIPKGLHRSLSVRAEDEGVSLNQYLVSALSCFSGYSAVLSEAKNTYGWYQYNKTTLFSGGIRRKILADSSAEPVSGVKVINIDEFKINKQLACN